MSTIPAVAHGAHLQPAAGHRLMRLASGLRVIIAPMRERASVSVALMFGVGSRHEPLACAGLAHFMEHIIFKGGAKYTTAKTVSEAIESVGGSLNAATDEESTVFWVKVPEGRLELACDVLADIAFHAQIPAAEVARERGVVIEELRMCRDNPQDHAATLFDELMWPDHVLGRDIAGTEETVEAFTREMCSDFLARHYHAANLVVSVAGATNHEQAIAALGPVLEAARPGTRSVIGPGPGGPSTERLRFVGRHIEQANIIIGTRGVSYRDPDRFAVDVLNVILGEGMSSRLFVQLREVRGIAYDVHSYTIKHSDTGAIAIFMGCEVRRTEEAIKQVRALLSGLATDTVGEDELRKARDYMSGRLILGLEGTGSLCNYLGEQELLNDEILTPDAVIARINAVTAEDVLRMARALFSDGLRAAMVGNFRRPERFEPLLAAPLI